MNAPAAIRLTPLKRVMSGRDIHEDHRVATPLELLFDLTFVVATAAAAAQLHHATAEGHLVAGLAGFVLTFFAIWWAWMGFTWFASAYDTDDVWYRLMTMLQMIGVLILAAGIPALAHGEATVGTIGYVVMRIGLVSMWLRAAREDPERRRTCMRYVWGILVVQTLWVLRLALPAEWLIPGVLVVMAIELPIPLWASRAGTTPWHAHHIAERYGLFTIIVLGECVLGGANALAGLLENTGWTVALAAVGLGSASLVLSLWWVYFLAPFGEALHHHRERVNRWGYGHAVVWASLVALGAFLGVVADGLKAHGQDAHAVVPVHAIGLVAVAVLVYLLAVRWLNVVTTLRGRVVWWPWLWAMGVLAAAVGAVAAGLPLAWGLLMVAVAPMVLIVVFELARRHQHQCLVVPTH